MFTSGKERFFRIVTGIFLVAGTCIGAGMLALPTRAAGIGFLPTVGIMVLCALLILFTGFLFFEAALWMKGEVHIVTLASRLLGKWGKLIVGGVYLFTAYAFLVGYVWAGGLPTALALNSSFSLSLTPVWGSALFTFFFLVIIYMGKRFAGSINTLLFTGLMMAFISLLTFGGGDISGSRLLVLSLSFGGLAPVLPVLLASFSMPGLVLSLVSFVGKDRGAVRWILFGGLGTVLLFYTGWLFVVIGSVPAAGVGSLVSAAGMGELASTTLSSALTQPFLARVARAFEFFALGTSFLGFGLALGDFLSDGLRMKSTPLHRLGLCCVIGIPVFILSQTTERVFDLAINLAGGLGDTVLSILVPALMVWSGRYRKGHSAKVRVWGGKALLLGVMAVATLMLTYNLIQLFM